MSKTLLAIFGGGCQMVAPGGKWAPTPDLEIWPLGENGGRSLVMQPIDDENPDSVVAMGELILQAGVVEYRKIRPAAVAISYGDNSPSLALPGQPSENEVMSNLFQQAIPSAKIERFCPDEWHSKGELSGTYHEAANFLRLVRRDAFDELFIVRREVHLRASAFTLIRLNEPEFADLKERVLAGNVSIHEETVESILWNASGGMLQYRLRTIHHSRSFQRSLLREGNALMNFGKGVTQVVQRPNIEQLSTAVAK